MEKMQEIRQQGTTIFYVSHATASVRSMCDRVLVLESGHLNFDGDVEEGIRYLQYDDDEETDDAIDDAELGADI
jgi:ABC-2 type transport system ATP-binding protein